MNDKKNIFIENLCNFCINKEKEECKNIKKETINNLTIYKCLNYKKEEKKMKSSKIAEKIIAEYNRKKRYENNIINRELNKFKKENCINCKNKNSNLCHIQKNIKKELQCVYKEI